MSNSKIMENIWSITSQHFIKYKTLFFWRVVLLLLLSLSGIFTWKWCTTTGVTNNIRIYWKGTITIINKELLFCTATVLCRDDLNSADTHLQMEYAQLTSPNLSSETKYNCGCVFSLLLIFIFLCFLSAFLRCSSSLSHMDNIFT